MIVTGEENLLATFLRHQSELLQFLTYKVSCNVAADDLLQETYLRIARIPNDSEIVNKRAFVYRIADNLAVDHLRGVTRQHKRDGGTVTEEIICTSPEPDTVLSGLQQMEMLEKFIYELPLQSRTVFLLCRVEGKSYSEVAKELGISVRTVENHVYKAMKLLKCQIGSI